MEKRRQLSVFLLLLLGSAIVMLLLSTSSPLYPTNPWVDANCYVTIGRGMREGLVPYRDLIDHKGPLLYGMHWLAALFSPGSFTGVYLLETVACAFFLFASWKTIRLYEADDALVPMLIGVAALLAASLAFVYGDSAEEFCTPLMAWSLYDALRYFRGKERMSVGCLLRNGILAGCVLWIKYSLLGLHFAWMAVIAIDSVVREKKVGPAVKMCLIFLGGMALSALPWLIYFGVNGAVADWLRVYFVQNMTEYKSESTLIVTLIKGLGGGALQNPFTFLLIAGGCGCILLDKGGVRQKICLVAMLACVSLLAYFGGRLFRYTYYVFSVFAPLGLIPLARLGKTKFSKRKRRYVAVVAVFMCIISLAMNPMLPRIACAKEDLVQQKFAREIHKTGAENLLNFGFQDGGFYLAADVQPAHEKFVLLNMSKEETLKDHCEVVEAGHADYVVTQNKKLEEYDVDASCYELILEGRDEYSKPRDQKNYFLYRKKGLEVG